MANMTSNATDCCIETGVFKPAYDACLIVLAFLIIAINVLVVYLFVTKGYLRTKTNCFLLSLALSDLLTGLLSIPLFLICSLTYRSQVCITSAVLYRCIAVSTMAHIMVVTLERYVAVMFPMRYYRMVTKGRICFCIALVWMLSTLYATIQLSWFNLGHHNISNIGDAIKYTKTYDITGLVIFFVIPLCVMTFCFCRMFLVIRRQVRNIRRQAELSADPRNRSIASEKRALIIFALMLGIFTVCWLSWYITLFQVELGPGAILPETFADILDFLRFGTSLFNPMLYTFLKNDFRRAVSSLLARCCIKYPIFKPKQNPNVSRITLTTDANGNKSTTLLNGLSSPGHDRQDEFVYKNSQDHLVKETENVQLITHV